MEPSIELSARSIRDYLDALADRTPTPGGGSVIALAVAAAAALARMVVAYSIRSDTAPETAALLSEWSRQLARADELARDLMTADAAAYARLREAGKAKKEGPAGEGNYQAAVLGAATVPLETAAVAAQVLSILHEGKSRFSRYLRSDLAVAAAMCDAAVRGAAHLLEVNAGNLSDGAVRKRMQDSMSSIGQRSAALRAEIEGFAAES